MRFSVQLPTERVELAEEFVSARAIARMARTAERAGGHHALDPFVALSFAEAVARFGAEVIGKLG